MSADSAVLSVTNFTYFCIVISGPAFWPVQVVWGKCHMLTMFYDGPRPVAQCFLPGSLRHEGESWKLCSLKTLGPFHFVLPTYDSCPCTADFPSKAFGSLDGTTVMES